MITGYRFARRLRFASPNQLACWPESSIIMVLQLAFAKKSLRDLCESEAKAQRDLGVRMAEKLKRRLADLRAATCVKDLVAGRPRELDARHRRIAVDLSEGSRIVFCANHKGSFFPVIKNSCGEDFLRYELMSILIFRGYKISFLRTAKYIVSLQLNIAKSYGRLDICDEFLAVS